jgi:hypothetical protein
LEKLLLWGGAGLIVLQILPISYSGGNAIA